jgi:hypothetical protein
VSTQKSSSVRREDHVRSIAYAFAVPVELLVPGMRSTLRERLRIRLVNLTRGRWPR